MTQKKKADKLTTEGLAKRLFPAEVRRKVKQEVAEKPKKSRDRSAIKSKDK